MKTINYRSKTLALEILNRVQKSAKSDWCYTTDSDGNKEVMFTLHFIDSEPTIYLLEPDFFKKYLLPFTLQT